ncbi:MAG: DUF3006 domain-containing protein [Oscillospiraceae bacterium]|nr:DUF3006 domain-containing protein [Oscillospiraceae bacterium]
MIYTVDRLEGDYAVLEDETGGMSQRLLTEIPIPVREGDKLEETEHGIILREDLKQAALERNRALLERLRKKKNQ